MAPITISSLNIAARNMIRFSNVSKTSKVFISYSAPRFSYTEADYYKYALNNKPQQTNVSNNAGGHVENSEMTFVKNCATSNSGVSDADDSFVPSVSSDEHVSGSGHKQH